MSVNAIQAQAVAAWLDIHGVSTVSEKTRYYEFIMALDMAFLKWNRSQEEEKDGKPNDSSSSN